MEVDEREALLKELAALSTTERTLKDILPPRTSCPSENDLFRNIEDTIPDCDFLRSHFYHEGMLTENQVMRIIGRGKSVLKAEPNMLNLPAPIIICGDIHGQYYDLLKLFDVGGGPPPAHRYLFLGDYVDRGYFSIECFLYLLALKICYPDQIYLLRGNHECRHLTKHFTFKLECGYKYSEAVYEECMLVFDALPLAAVVNKQFFCTHGGLGPELGKPMDVNIFDRFQEPPKRGLMCDLLWSDPTTNYGEDKHESFTMNMSRGCSYRFSSGDCTKFLDKNKLLAVIRGHEAQNEGYRLYKAHPKTDFPTLITLFSAPNYVDVYNNKGAILFYDGNTFNIRQFGPSPHPFYLPKFMDAFDWSLPFVGQNVTDLLLALLNIPSMRSKLNELTEDQRMKLETIKARKQDEIIDRIQTVSRAGKLFASIRAERESLTELVNAVGTDITPPTELFVGEEELRESITTFDEAKVCDKINEMEPSNVQDEDDAASVISGGSFGGETVPVNEAISELIIDIAGEGMAKEMHEKGDNLMDVLVQAVVDETNPSPTPQQ